MIAVFKHTNININKSIEDLAYALQKKPHPFSNLVIDADTNFFDKVIHFALENTPELLYTIARHTLTLESLCSMDPGKVIKLATTYSHVVCSQNPSIHSTFRKWLAVVTQSYGLTNDGLDVLATLGYTEGSR